MNSISIAAKEKYCADFIKRILLCMRDKRLYQTFNYVFRHYVMYRIIIAHFPLYPSRLSAYKADVGEFPTGKYGIRLMFPNLETIFFQYCYQFCFRYAGW